MGPLTEKGMHSCCAHGISQSMPFDSNFKSAFSSLYVVGCTLRIHSGISIYPVFDGFLFQETFMAKGEKRYKVHELISCYSQGTGRETYVIISGASFVFS